jgi:hypothetical protein
MIATLITNGYLLSRDRIRRLNRAGLDHLQISIDNVTPDEVSKKSLKVLDQKLRYGFEDLRREYHRVKRCAPLCTVGCVHRVAQVDELRQNPHLALSQWFSGPERGGQPRLPTVVRILMWAFVTNPRRELFRNAAVRVLGSERRP